MSLSLGKALAFFTTPAQVNNLITQALATRGITIDVANYTALVTNYPPASYNGAFAWVEASQGTAWLPGNLGGTYYPLGLYHSNGTAWIFTPSPSQATQAEVDTGTNNDKFVTPLTFTNASKWATKQNSITVANTTTNANFYPTFVSATGALTTLNTSTANFYVNPSNGNINTNGVYSGVGVSATSYVNCSAGMSASTMTAYTITSLGDLIGPTITSTSGGNGTTSALSLTGNNGYGGTNYYGAITINNTGATNGKKYLRVNTSGGLEIINNAYTSTIWSLSDTGSSYSQTVTGDNINASTAISSSGTITSTGMITGNSSTAFRATSNAVNNVSLEMANTSAIRNTGDIAENIMYFDINTGGSNRGHFRFRGTSSYTTYCDINPDGIQALTPYTSKSSFNVALDTVVTADNYKFRISNQGGVFPQVESNTSGNVDSCWSYVASVASNATPFGQNSGILVANNAWSTIFNSHGLDSRGDTVIVHITDKNAGKIYRVTFLVTNNSSNTTGYNIMVERLI